MARAVWSGAISFGLVSIPVKAYTAVREHTIHFHQLDKGSGSRVRYQKVAEKTGKELQADDIEQAYEISPGTYVPIDASELAELRPRTTKMVEVDDFVDLAAIDPIYYDATYWLVPDGEPAARAYRLLHAAMVDAERAGVGKVVMRTKQHLAAIRPLGDGLVMSTMRFADEVVDASAVEGLPTGKAKGDEKPSPKEKALAMQIIDSLTTDWKPERYHDTYTEQLKDLIEAKAKGKEIVVEDAPEESADIVDLMAALEASLAASKSGTRSPTEEAPAKKKAPAKKASAAKKTAKRKTPAKRAS